LKPDSAIVHTNLGLALELLGRLDEAVKHDELAVRLDPESRAAQTNLASARAKLGRASR
jgi:tetratricopeptide (TPR) repeat protein